MSDLKKILLVEDDLSLQEIALHQLKTSGYEVQSFTSAEKAWGAFAEFSPDLLLTDLVLEGGMNGDELLKKVQTSDKSVPVILMTANGSIESAVDCVRSGAWNYLTKPFHWDDMLDQIEKALRFRGLQKENLRLKGIVGSYKNFHGIIGNSTAMVNVKKQMPRLANSDAPVLIQGESGTGKELVARSLHVNSSREDGPFIAVNCGAIVKELAESELFGHTKGAFTGAYQDKKGYFLEADGGTLFLDEISELPTNLQVKLLRVLQEREVTPVGQATTRPVNTRLVTATNVDLQEAVSQGDFREDLFYRVSVLPIQLPPLRERHGDLEELCRMFLQKAGCEGRSISASLLTELQAYHWPGNIRELENFITRLSVMNPDVDIFEPQHMPELMTKKKVRSTIPYEIPSEGLDLELHMRRLIESALMKSEGNQTRAAKMLGISRSALIYRMQKYELESRF